LWRFDVNNEIEVRRLVIKTFHITDIVIDEKTYIENGVLHLRRGIEEGLVPEEPLIKDAKVSVIYPNAHDMFVNSIMDFSPVAAKVLGRMGEGITHALTGMAVMLTGVDENGIQVAEFGSSEGILSEQVVFDRAGTPSAKDLILHIDVTLTAGGGSSRPGPTAAHRLSDAVVQEIREYLKRMNGRFCDEKHEYYDKIKPGKKKVVIIKQVAGQGAMYDTQLLGREPGGFAGGRSIIDMGNMPLVLSPNEYRDGALRAMN
jgi:D-proline reductase (dithiol)-stabilizing protein PrdD